MSHPDVVEQITGDATYSTDGSQRRLLYLAPHKVDDLWEQFCRSIASVVVTNSKSKKVKAGPTVKLTWGKVLSFLGLPEASLGFDASAEFGRETSQAVSYSVTPHMKALILQRFFQTESLVSSDWMTSSELQRIAWAGNACLTLARQESEKKKLVTPHTWYAVASLIGEPSALPAWLKESDVGSAFAVKASYFDGDPFGVFWINGERRAVSLLTLKYTRDFHRYVHLKQPQVFFFGEALEWVESVRFLNPCVLWLLEKGQ